MLKDIATLSEFIILYSLKMTLFFRVSLRVILLTLSKEAGLIEKNILHDNQPSCCNKLGKKGQLNDPQVLTLVKYISFKESHLNNTYCKACRALSSSSI